MKSLGIAINKGEVCYSLIEGTNRNDAVIIEVEKELYRVDSPNLMLDFHNIFVQLVEQFNPDIVSYKLSLDVNLQQIPYMHYSIGILLLLCLQKGITTNERSINWITVNKKAKI